MNKPFSFWLLTILFLGFTACSSDDDGPEPDVIWDINPTGVYIQIVDEDGNNLLDPDVKGNWVGEEMFISSEDKQYPAKWSREDVENNTRDILPRFYGLVWQGVFSWNDPKASPLYFGELDGGEDHDLSLSFTVPSIDKTFDFRFTYHFFWKKHKPQREIHLIYDGKDYDKPILTLVLPPNPAKSE